MIAIFDGLKDVRVLGFVVNGRIFFMAFGNCFVTFRNHCVTISHEGVIRGIDTEQLKNY
jgi:uncharacterized ParB-like nuclease family protein